MLLFVWVIWTICDVSSYLLWGVKLPTTMGTSAFSIFSDLASAYYPMLVRQMLFQLVSRFQYLAAFIAFPSSIRRLLRNFAFCAKSIQMSLYFQAMPILMCLVVHSIFSFLLTESPHVTSYIYLQLYDFFHKKNHAGVGPAWFRMAAPLGFEPRQHRGLEPPALTSYATGLMRP